MTDATYVHHRISVAPRRWREVAEALAARQVPLADSGGALYGLWRSQIGLPRDDLTAITVWSTPVDAAKAQAVLIGEVENILAATGEVMTPTLRPTDTRAPTRQGNYAFRWFLTPERDWQEFLSLCAQAWPGFEAAYDSQVIGLWRCTGEAPGDVRSLLLTRRPNLAMWERSKLPQGAEEAKVRDTLSRRYDLCSWTVVYTTTLLTASDGADDARWT